MPPHPLTNFEIQKYYINEPRFSGAFSRNNSPTIKDGANVANQCILILYVNGGDITYFDSFEVEQIPKKIKKSYKQQKYHNKYF